MNNITFNQFVNLLESRQIQLYDYHKRISYVRYLQLNQHIQKGGGLLNSFNKNKIFDLQNPQLERVILDLVNKDFKDINKIIDIYF